jgi:predicted DNA-binding transcriptional regulator YafY
MNRIDRLTAILIHLQSKKVVRAEEMADRFEISLRTVYRDVKALMEAGVPIGSEAGKGYFIVDGYHLPPVMFTQDEAGAMLLAGKFVEKMSDKSVRKAFESAMFKIKSVMSEAEKDHLDHLQAHIEVFVSSRSAKNQGEFPDHFITEIQRAVVQKQVLKLDYISNQEELSQREVEPIGLFYYSGAWHLIAWCRLRNGYRDFRADRIKELVNTSKNFEGRNLLSLQEYFQTMFQTNQGLMKAVITFDKSALGGRPVYGSISQTDLGHAIRAEFMMDDPNHMARWLLMFGSSAEIEEPESLKIRMAELIEELQAHYGKVGVE